MKDNKPTERQDRILASILQHEDVAAKHQLAGDDSLLDQPYQDILAAWRKARETGVNLSRPFLKEFSFTALKVTPAQSAALTSIYNRCLMMNTAAGDYALIDLLHEDRKNQQIATALQQFGSSKDLPSLIESLTTAEQTRQMPRTWSLSQLLGDKNIMQQPAFIEGLLRRGEILNLVAAPKTRKSWAVLDLAICLASGTSWLGRFSCQQSTVCLIDNELHLATLKHRASEIVRAKGINITDMPVQIASVRGKQFTLNDVAQFVQINKPQVLILDALYRFFPEGFDENSNSQMTQLYGELDGIATKSNVSIILVHHASKGGQSLKSVTDVGSGAGAQSRAADTHLILRPVKADGDAAKEQAATLDCVTRSFPPNDRIYLDWEYPLWKSSSAPIPPPMEEEDKMNTFLDCFTDQFQPAGVISEVFGKSVATFNKYRELAENRSLIECKPEGNKRLYRLNQSQAF